MTADPWAQISYAHEEDPLGQRYIQRGADPLPKWAVDVRPHVELPPVAARPRLKRAKPMIDLTIPDNIRNARQALGLTQSQLADALQLEGNWGKDTVRSWESGKRPISGPARVAIGLLLEKARRRKRG